VFVAAFAAIFGLYSIGGSWFGPVKVEAEISQNPRSLPLFVWRRLYRLASTRFKLES
jgi:hypothetical protein